MKFLLRLLLLALLGPAGSWAAEPGAGTFVVIAHPSVGRIDLLTLRRVYTGRAIEAGGVPVNPVNLVAGQSVRDRFLTDVVGEDNDKYVAYWTVRRHIGKGVPPRELKTPAEVIDFVQSTPGGLGYIPASELRPGLNVVFKP